MNDLEQRAAKHETAEYLKGEIRELIAEVIELPRTRENVALFAAAGRTLRDLNALIAELTLPK